MYIKFEIMGFRKQLLHYPVDCKDTMPKTFPACPRLAHEGKTKQTNTHDNQTQAPFAAAHIKP